MAPAVRPRLSAFAQFLRTPTLGRSLVALLGGAILLLLAANFATFVLLQRTVRFNDEAELSQQTRRAARTLLIDLLDAETGQRGYVLTRRSEFLEPYSRAAASLEDHVRELEALTADDPELRPAADALAAAARDKSTEMRRVVDLTRMGRDDAALAAIRAGQGRRLMDEVRARVAAIDGIEAERLSSSTLRSERGARVTVLANAAGGLLILVLAGVSLVIVRRYVGEIQRAREALDTLNAGLETQVGERTAQLTRANEEIQRFAYIVSHDLRAPLVNVMGYTSELEQAGKVVDRQIATVEAEAPALVDRDAVLAVREDVPEAIGFIRASTEKMDRLINAILRLSREGRRTLTPEILDVSAMLRQIADSVHHPVEAQGAEIVIDDLPQIESDRLSLEQVFGNLIDNAVKYLDADRPGRITISGEAAPGGWVVYRVADNGRGISERDHERIFELFRRSGRQDRAGEGLGLAFVRNSVRRLGGDVTVESALGKGSTFTLKLPTRLVQGDEGEIA